MATAISYVSESGDHYLSLYTTGSYDKIVNLERTKFCTEFEHLYIIMTVSDTLDRKILEQKLHDAIILAQSTEI